VLVTTTKFRPVATALATATGLPDLRMLVVEHPIGGVDCDTLCRRAAAACDALVSLFTGVRTTVLPLPNGAPSDADRAIDELRTLVAADGADLEPVAFDAGTGQLHVRLIIPDAHCAECVMPRAALESIASSRLAGHGVRTVVIDDPRESAR
jgi:hypothetical protein